MFDWVVRYTDDIYPLLRLIRSDCLQYGMVAACQGRVMRGRQSDVGLTNANKGLDPVLPSPSVALARCRTRIAVSPEPRRAKDGPHARHHLPGPIA
jgi:hypothetical protein